jgi:hypothetical protein
MEREPAFQKQYEQLFRHMNDVYNKTICDAVSEAQTMRAVLASLEEGYGITTRQLQRAGCRQLQRAGCRMPPLRVDEEDRIA